MASDRLVEEPIAHRWALVDRQPGLEPRQDLLDIALDLGGLLRGDPGTQRLHHLAIEE